MDPPIEKQHQDGGASAPQASSAVISPQLAKAISDKDQIATTIRDMPFDTKEIYSALKDPKEYQSENRVIVGGIDYIITQNASLTNAGKNILSIDPNYQDKSLQTLISSAYLQSIGLTKVFDRLRNAYIVLDSTGTIVPNPDVPSNRSYAFAQRGGQRGGASGPTILPTDILLTTDKSFPTPTTWASYFDTVARLYFYVDTSTGVSQYEHPFPPDFSGSDTIISDGST